MDILAPGKDCYCGPLSSAEVLEPGQAPTTWSEDPLVRQKRHLYRVSRRLKAFGEDPSTHPVAKHQGVCAAPGPVWSFIKGEKKVNGRAQLLIEYSQFQDGWYLDSSGGSQHTPEAIIEKSDYEIWQDCELVVSCL